MSVFFGGVHPKENKISRHYHLDRSILPSRVILHLSQHTGKISKPLVKQGDNVLCGQKVAEADGLISSPVHSPISGKVKEIKEFIHPVIGSKLPAIYIESDGVNKSIEFSAKYKDYFRHNRSDLVNYIRECGIVGLGGAMFPTAVKLSPPKEKEIDTVLLNGCECEPFLTCDDRLMQEYSKEIIEGLKIVMYILDVSKGLIVVEENKIDAYRRLKEVAFRVPNIDIMKVKTKYPQGAEKQLIKTALNRVVPSGGLPMDVGVIVVNVATAYAIYNAIINGKPLFERAVTITGNIERIGNFIVPIGTLVSDIVKILSIDVSGINKIVFGGPMMGIAVNTLDVPVIKGTSGILFLKDLIENYEFLPCIRCAKCVSVCPQRLMPNFLSIYVENEIWEKVKKFSPYDCIECGCCSYVCVANRPIVSQIKYAKAKLKYIEQKV